MSKSISRKEFLKGTAVGAMGIAAMGLVGCSNTAPKETAVSVQTAPPVETAAPEEKTNTPDEVLDCDVVVVGVGVAGISACVEAAAAGSKVIGIDRAISVAGTNAVNTAGIYGVGDPSEIGEHFRQMTKTTYYQFNNRFISHYLRVIEDQVARYEENGISFRNVTQYPTPEKPGQYGADSILGSTQHLFKKKGQERAVEYEALMAKYSDNLSLMWRTEVTELIVEDGKVTGCYAKDPDGKLYQINAKGGVVICCGGFIHDEEMVKQYMGGVTVYSWANKFCDGAGIKLAQSAGAQIGKNFAINCSEGGGVNHKAAEFMTDGFGINGLFRAPILGDVIFNKHGQRFVDESVMCKRTMMFCGEPITREGGTFYTIMSQAELNKLRDTTMFDYVKERYGFEISHAMILMAFANNKMPDIDKDVETALSEGWCWKGDTFEELEEKSGIPMAATMKEYNEMCKNGQDTLLFKDEAFLQPYNETDGPFYLIENDFSGWSTQGGIKTTGNCEAVTSENDIIPGLYVAGTDADIESAPYVIGATCQGFSIGSGYIAAEAAVQRAKA